MSGEDGREKCRVILAIIALPCIFRHAELRRVPPENKDGSCMPLAYRAIMGIMGYGGNWPQI